MVQEVEDQRVKHLQGRGTDGTTVPAGLVGAAVEVAGTVPEAHGWKRTVCVVLSDHTGQGE